MSKTILITGVGKRVGFYLAQHLSQEGYQVVGTYRTLRPALQKLEALGVKLFQCDFYDIAQTEQLIAELKANYSSLRGIIHNASDWLPDKDHECAIATIEKMMRIHASTPYALNLALAPLLQSNQLQFSDIIHITDYVVDKGSKKHAAYAASKAALQNLTLSFAAKYAPKIKVNSIAPAMLMFNPDDDDNYKQKALNKALIKQEGGEVEALRAVKYLLDSSYTTGQTLKIDGGRHLV
ncbi:dihydromonapterin reductase [Shewanella fidelis]|uniref:Dihydromonapterin reductase n=1 Tax=Shewanella fidelis TaxID=173509 RepID=A0AAW8NVI7_9GAMM|nr:dihydromonapterin reductase [Shewanella fidelis]MDR8525969.1 dihydromonapterin reductase [Shewanella fidelis]MDW4813843.1 dihydromonapterin reductase [Shewanella fidelis]MDW4817965.1 dihydromonapterin reductase [Shewanella fidelis]MDW4822032.1 dihydromonapterin reductase [Shewanella fidelis]MDW4826197.1 dihydromonapterin reductase [Shewanella fidelis]